MKIQNLKNLEKYCNISLRKAFTLVELIIVITILSILATIGLMSFQGYMGDARDASRTTSLDEIRKGLEIYQVKNSKLPIPTNSVSITASGVNIGYQGIFGKTEADLIKMNSSPIDPLDNTGYVYSINSLKNKFQLLTFLENQTAYNKAINDVYAIDYSNRKIKTIGDKLGIILNNDNSPITSSVDVVNTTENYKVISSNLIEAYIGVGNYININSCNDWINRFGSLYKKDGIYSINPNGTGVFKVYCDMTTDGGGWTRVFYSNSDNVPRTSIDNEDWNFGNTTNINFSILWRMRNLKNLGKYEFFIKDSSFIGRYIIFTQNNAYFENPVGNNFIKKSGNLYFSSWTNGSTWYGLSTGNYGTTSSMNNNCTLSIVSQGSTRAFCLQDQVSGIYNTGPWFYDNILNPGTGYDPGSQEWVMIYQR